MNTTGPTRIRVVGGLALGLGLLLWFLSGLQWAALAEVLRHVSWGWLALAAGLMLFDYYLHAWRWKVLLVHVDRDVPMASLWNAMTVQWGFNTLLPLRAGNVLRPAMLARERRLPFTTVLFTEVGEYVCDAFAVVVMLLLTLFSLPTGLLSATRQHELKTYGSLAAVVALVLLLLVVVMSSRQARDVAERVLSPLPAGRLRERLLAFFDELVAGMAAVGRPLLLIRALGVTFLTWATYLLAILATFHAFGLELPASAGLFVMAALTLAMMVPQAPGFIGLFQVVTAEGLALYGAPTAEAQGVALVFWVVSFVPVTILGVIAASRAGLALGQPDDSWLSGDPS